MFGAGVTGRLNAQVSVVFGVIAGVLLFIRRRWSREQVVSASESVPRTAPVCEMAPLDVSCIKKEEMLDKEYVREKPKVSWSCPGLFKGKEVKAFSAAQSTFFELFFARCLTAVNRPLWTETSENVSMPWIASMWLHSNDLDENNMGPTNLRCRTSQWELELIDLCTGRTMPFERQPAFFYSDVFSAVLPHFQPLERRGQRLPREDAEFVMVSAFVRSSMKQSEIVRIDKIHNSALGQAFDTCCRLVEAKRKDKNDLKKASRMLFHGTDLYAAANIVEQGFNPDCAGRSNGTAYGSGIYFAREAQEASKYASKFCGRYAALLCCRVVSSCYDTSSNELDKYAGVVDSLECPSLFVVQKREQAYPQYVVYFAL